VPESPQYTNVPEMNHSSSSATPRQNTRLVVSTGSTSPRSEKRIVSPNLLMVPVPVRSPRVTPVLMMSLQPKASWGRDGARVRWHASVMSHVPTRTDVLVGSL
jgi:hypothetical protein